ncbi:hypothetical protein HGI30_06495 [Paenibacillus albicereus]|uniref:TATA-box binding protein n=1 Tax=Paenibacillus albicereus TaxID=2726185 RepID=A0A6H2GUZ2_9BACL|nr:hypothetical protein [Paenibacillus albicereus]QJC51230.1 hypothetical protein HGI30_06495 [Paenibacillus albicereus]
MQAREADRKRRARQAFGLGAAALLLAVLAIVSSSREAGAPGWGARDKPARSSQLQSASMGDLGRLWQWAEADFSGGAAGGSWGLRWLVPGLTKEQAERLPGELAGGDGSLPPLTDESGTESGILWKAERTDESGHWLLSGLHGGDGESAPVEAVIRLQSAELASKAVLEQAQERVLGALRAVGADDASALLSIQASGSGLRGDSAERILAAAEARRLDRYEDDVMILSTYASGRLDGAVGLAEGGRSERANLQLAATKPGKEGGGGTLTIGVPLLTGEAGVP